MAKLSIQAGKTSQSINVFIQDSSSTTGAGLSGIAPAGGSLLSGFKASYSFSGANAARVSMNTLAVLATVGTAWASNAIVEIDATEMKGVYRVDIPDAALATSKGRSVTFFFYGGTNVAPLAVEVELTGWDNQDAVRGGLTALPNAAANAAGGLPVSSAGGLDLDEMNVDIEAIQTSTAGLTFTGAGKVDASVRDWIGGTIPAVNVTGVPLVDLKYTLGTISPAPAGSVRADAVTGAVGSVTGNVGGSVASIATAGIAAASFAAGAIDAASIAASAIGSSELAAGAITSAKFATDAIDANALAASAAAEIVTAVFAHAFAVAYGSFTFEQVQDIMLAALAAKCSGMGTTTGTFRNIADSADVIVATIDASGNRTALTLTP